MNLHKTVVVQDSQRLFIVGDIHGCYDLLMEALEKAGCNINTDVIVCVGDLIDRGEDNFGVLSLFLNRDNFHTVRGNHDEFMITDDYVNWMGNGGLWSTEVDQEIITDIAKDMDKAFPYFMTLEFQGNKYGIVHGGVPFKYMPTGLRVESPVWDNVIKDRTAPVYLWDRDVIKEIAVKMYRDGYTGSFAWKDLSTYTGKLVNIPDVLGVKFVFHGHTYVPDPIVHGNRVYLDTGGVFNGRLTVAEVTQAGLKFTTTGV